MQETLRQSLRWIYDPESEVHPPVLNAAITIHFGEAQSLGNFTR